MKNYYGIGMEWKVTEYEIRKMFQKLTQKGSVKSQSVPFIFKCDVCI